MNSNVENDSTSLYTRKMLPNWSICDQFIINWSKSKGFGVIKDKVVKEESDIRQRMYICKHRKKYAFNSMRETSTKKMLCPQHVNASYPKVNNLDSAVFINKIVNEYNYIFNIEAIAFRKDKSFNKEIMDDI